MRQLLDLDRGADGIDRVGVGHRLHAHRRVAADRDHARAPAHDAPGASGAAPAPRARSVVRQRHVGVVAARQVVHDHRLQPPLISLRTGHLAAARRARSTGLPRTRSSHRRRRCRSQPQRQRAVERRPISPARTVRRSSALAAGIDAPRPRPRRRRARCSRLAPAAARRRRSRTPAPLRQRRRRRQRGSRRSRRQRRGDGGRRGVGRRRGDDRRQHRRLTVPSAADAPAAGAGVASPRRRRAGRAAPSPAASAQTIAAASSSSSGSHSAGRSPICRQPAPRRPPPTARRSGALRPLCMRRGAARCWAAAAAARAPAAGSIFSVRQTLRASAAREDQVGQRRRSGRPSSASSLRAGTLSDRGQRVDVQAAPLARLAQQRAGASAGRRGAGCGRGERRRIRRRLTHRTARGRTPPPRATAESGRAAGSPSCRRRVAVAGACARCRSQPQRLGVGRRRCC